MVAPPVIVYPEFSGKWFWVCGASSGIGFAVAMALARSGAKLIIMSRHEAKLQEAKGRLLAAGAAEVDLAALDLTDPRTSEHAKRLLADRSLQGVLLNGGGPQGNSASACSWEQFEQTNRLLLAGPASLAIAFLPHLCGSIVAITSTTVKEPNPKLPLSAAYRSGLAAFLKHLSDELGPKGIRINCVAPGYTDTERLKELAAHVVQESKLGGGQGGGAVSMQDVYAQWANQAALQRLASPEEIAAVSVFLFSSQASFITGQTVVVDGGQVRGY